MFDFIQNFNNTTNSLQGASNLRTSNRLIPDNVSLILLFKISHLVRVLAKQSNSAGFRNRVDFDFQFLHIARYSLRWITIDFLVNTLNVVLLGRVPSLTLGYGTLRILPKPRQSTDFFFFILKKIINIRGFKYFIHFYRKRK